MTRAWTTSAQDLYWVSQCASVLVRFVFTAHDANRNRKVKWGECVFYVTTDTTKRGMSQSTMRWPRSPESVPTLQPPVVMHFILPLKSGGIYIYFPPWTSKLEYNIIHVVKLNKFVKGPCGADRNSTHTSGLVIVVTRGKKWFLLPSQVGHLTRALSAGPRPVDHVFDYLKTSPRGQTEAPKQSNNGRVCWLLDTATACKWDKIKYDDFVSDTKRYQLKTIDFFSFYCTEWPYDLFYVLYISSRSVLQINKCV